MDKSIQETVKVKDHASITIQVAESGISLNDLICQLQSKVSPEALSLCLEAIYALKNQPNCEKRNAKYAETLDALYDWIPISDLDWRTLKMVTFENVEIYEDVFNELMNIDLHVSKKGRNGFTEDARLFSGHGHVHSDPDNYIDCLEFNDDIEISEDYRISLNRNWISIKELGDTQNDK